MAKQTILDIAKYNELFEGKSFSLQKASASQISDFQKNISQFLKTKLTSLLNDSSGDLDFYFLGSYARDEASYYSDIDLVISGEKEASDLFKNEIVQKGLPLRSRHLEDLPDFKDMDPITLMSFLKASEDSVSPVAMEKLKYNITSFLKEDAKKFIGSLKEENDKRRSSYDSISNYLEPNLKFQPGGLRDLQQVWILLDSFKVLKKDLNHLYEKLEYYKSTLLLIRQYLHTKVRSDVLLAPYQQEVAEYFGFESIRDFMSFVQNICSESAFLCQWLFEIAEKGELDAPLMDLNTLIHCILDSKKRNDIRWQKLVRDFLDSELIEPVALLNHPEFGKVESLVSSNVRGLEEFMFQAKLFDFLIPDFARVRYLVQHDQYHRYTVGAHTLVCIRNLFRLIAGEFPLKYFSEELKKIDSIDISILFYTALFHDLGKGLPEDHSVAGQKIVDTYLPRLTKNKDLVREVNWLVKNHLLFSKVAFRTNLSSSATFQRLEKEDICEKRARRLILFTLVDISSSNPEALTEWKESLLHEFYYKWSHPENRFDSVFRDEIDILLGEDLKAISENLDLDLLSMLEEKEVVDLLTSFKALEEGYQTKFYTVSQARYIIAYMDSNGEKGLLNSLLNFAVGAGYNLVKVNANSCNSKVLDLFLISDDRDLKVLTKIWEAYKRDIQDFKLVYPQNTKWGFFNNSQWLAMAEGPSFKDILLGLTNELYLKGLDIDWVNIYKWGRQNEVVLGLSKNFEPKKEWLKNQLEI